MNRDTMGFATKLSHIEYADGARRDIMKRYFFFFLVLVLLEYFLLIFHSFSFIILCKI
jgi:hypothetical protein